MLKKIAICAVGLAIVGASLFADLKPGIVKDARFQDLVANPHGDRRWINVNELHKDYKMARDEILKLAKELHKAK